MHAAIVAAGCLLQYAKETQRAALPHIRALQVERREESVIIGCGNAPKFGISNKFAGGEENTLASVSRSHAHRHGQPFVKALDKSAFT